MNLQQIVASIMMFKHESPVVMAVIPNCFDKEKSCSFKNRSHRFTLIVTDLYPYLAVRV